MNWETPNDFFFGLLLVLILAVLGSLILSATVNHRYTLLWQLRLFLVALVLRFSFLVIYEFDWSTSRGRGLERLVWWCCFT